MANKKISELNSASILTGVEEFAVVQSGVTKKTTINNIKQEYGTSFTIQDGDTINLGEAGFSGYDLYLLKWIGGNGNQNATITLPDVSDSGRIIRIITNGSFTSNTHARLTSKSGQTIDGLTEYVINKAYEAVTIWSDGTEWIVIQAKAH
jgi:hypothetical protein